MSWSGGTYRKGNYSSNGWTGDSSLGIGIEASRHDDQDDDFETGINTCLTKDGGNTATADLPMGGFKHTVVANATARNQYSAVGQVQDSSFHWCGTSGGSANAQTLTPTPAITAYATGQVFRFVAGFTPTATVTLAVSGLAAKNIFFDQVNVQLGNLAFHAGMTCEVIYDGTQFIMWQGTLLSMANYDAAATSRALQFYKSRGTAYPTNTIVAAEDGLGVINFWGANGTGYDRAAYIAGHVDGTPGASNDMPARLTFATSPNASASAVERMRISNDGKIAIGGAAAQTDYVYVQNNVANNIYALVAQSHVAGDVGQGSVLIVKKDNNTTTSQVLLRALTNGGVSGQGQINANGANQMAFGSFSDARLKENIVDLPSQLTNILCLRPVEFDYKDGSGHQLGFIAQEVREVYPDLVGEDSEGFLTLSDLNKNDARVIKALQELHAKVAALEARIEQLEA